MTEWRNSAGKGERLRPSGLALAQPSLWHGLAQARPGQAMGRQVCGTGSQSKRVRGTRTPEKVEQTWQSMKVK